MMTSNSFPSNDNIFEFMTSEWQLPAVPSPCVTIKFRNARSRNYFEVAHEQEINSAPYKYNILLENSSPQVKYKLSLALLDAQGQTEPVLDGLTIERQVNKTYVATQFMANYF